MELTGDLKKKVAAAESRDEAREAIADAGMELTDDELESVSGGVSFGKGGGNPFETFRVINAAGAPIWDEAAAPEKRSQIGLYPFGAELRIVPCGYSCYLTVNKQLNYYLSEEDGYPRGYVLTTDVTRA